MSKKIQNEDPIMPRTKEVSDETVLNILEKHYAPYMTAEEVAQEVGMSRQGMHSRLSQLEDEGQIRKKKTGRSVGWWAIEEVKNPSASETHEPDPARS